MPSLSNNAVNKTLRKIIGREVRVHSLRHTYASYLIAHDIDLISVSQVLGHEKPKHHTGSLRPPVTRAEITQ